MVFDIYSISPCTYPLWVEFPVVPYSVPDDALAQLENASDEGTGLNFGKALEDELAVDRIFGVDYQGNRLQRFGSISALQKGGW